MTSLPRFIYRGLRYQEISSGCVLIPKSQRPFLAPVRLPNILPFNLGENVEHAVREHQWVEKSDSTGKLEPLFETSGVSATPHYHRALHYAGNKVLVKIDTSLFSAFGIRAHRVEDYVPKKLICVPEDDEIILVCEESHPFPKEIIQEIVRLA